MDKEIPSKEFIEGFNHGYLMSKYQPDLISKILKSPLTDIKSDYLAGIIEGENQFNHEKQLFQEEIKQWENSIRINPRKLDKDQLNDPEL